MLLNLFKISFIVLVCLQTASGQLASLDEKYMDKKFASLSFRKVLDEGSRLVEKIRYQDASQRADVLRKVALAAYNVHDYKLAESYFQSLFELQNEDTQRAALLPKYAHVLAALGKYEDAAEIWSRYAALNPDDVLAADFALLHKDISPLIKNASSFTVKFLPVNSGLSEFSPTRRENGLVFVASRPAGGPVKRVFEWDESPFLDLYFLANESDIFEPFPEVPPGNARNPKLGSDYYTSATPNDGLKLGYNYSTISGEKAALEASLLDSKLNSMYHDGPADFFNKSQSIIFTRNGVPGFDYPASDGINRVHLYIADQDKDKWSNLRAFPFNSAEYSTGHPAFNIDESLLYFISDMPGGFGGTDIYFSRYKDGKWHMPVNAGPKVNTRGNEMFPFVDELNNLYFASDGHPGLGGLDIFTTPLNSNGFPQYGPANLGSPINSGSDDFGFMADSDFRKGYFSSNRKNGGSDDDLYSFERSGEKFGCREIELAVNDASDSKPMAGLEFVWYSVDDPSVTHYGQLDQLGKARLCLPADSEFYLEFNKAEYDSPRKYLSTKGLQDFKPTAFEINLKKIVRKIDAPVYSNSKMMSRVKDKASAEIYAGTILGPDNLPLEGVQVRFINKCDNAILEQRTTKDGHYSFERDPGCDYEFIAIRSGFSTSYEFVSKSVNTGPTRIARSTSTFKSSDIVIEEDRSVSKATFKVPEENTTTFKAPVASKTKVNSAASESTAKSAGARISFFDPRYFKVGDVIQMENIYYNDSEVAVSALAKNDLNQVVAALDEYPDMIIDVISHTDSRGDAKENLRISQRRADEIKQYLISQGVDIARIRAIGMGESSPVNGCTDGVKCTDAEYRRNRRTEFRILRIEKL